MDSAKIRSKAHELARSIYLEPSETPDSTRVPFRKMIDAIFDEILLPEFEKARVSQDVCDSEAFMWLMAGANHSETHLEALRPAYQQYRKLGGGYGNHHSLR